MEVTCFEEGLWRWTTLYGEWGEAVGSVYLEAPDAIVLIDPLVPEQPLEAERFWRALDRDVAKASVPVHTLVTVFWHARSAGEIARRYEGRVHAVSRGRAAVDRRTGGVSDVFRAGETLPGGIEAFATGRGSEAIFWIPAHRTLVPGDVVLGDNDLGLRLCPESWLPHGVRHDRVRAALEPLLDLPVERVLVSHGDPVTSSARPKLAAALADSPDGNGAP